MLFRLLKQCHVQMDITQIEDCVKVVVPTQPCRISPVKTIHDEANRASPGDEDTDDATITPTFTESVKLV